LIVFKAGVCRTCDITVISIWLCFKNLFIWRGKLPWQRRSEKAPGLASGIEKSFHDICIVHFWH
jgi:hypothetical protein